MKTLVLLKKLKSSLLVMSFLMFTSLSAQNSILSSGGDISITSGSVSYSVGQVFNDFYDYPSGSVTQGVQQPYEISEMTGLPDNENTRQSVSVYPNPAIDLLTLKLDASYAPGFESLRYKLFNTNGNLLETKKLKADQTIIAMNNFKPGIYLLKIMQDNKEIITFKIIKN